METVEDFGDVQLKFILEGLKDLSRLALFSYFLQGFLSLETSCRA